MISPHVGTATRFRGEEQVELEQVGILLAVIFISCTLFLGLRPLYDGRNYLPPCSVSARSVSENDRGCIREGNVRDSSNASC